MSWMFYTPSGVAKTGEFVGIDIPVGTVVSHTGTTVPNGWLFCDGAAVSRTTYADLFNVISTNYGAGNGTTTFNIPDSTGSIISYQSFATKVSGTGDVSASTADAADSSYALFIGG